MSPDLAPHRVKGPLLLRLKSFLKRQISVLNLQHRGKEYDIDDINSNLIINGHGCTQIVSANSKIEDVATLYNDLETDIAEVRVMKLFPGKWEDPIKLDLMTISLQDDHPPFEALSYVWEAETGNCDITVSGTPRQITTNLFLALRRLRKTHAPRLLWADAICIDQTNEAEKSHQVGHMGEIYRSCERVYLWLGDYINTPPCGPPDTKTIEDGIDALWFKSNELSEKDELDEGYRALKIIYELAANKHVWDYSFFTKVDNGIMSPHHINHEYLESFSRLMSSQWWNRLWVVQETILPNEAITLYGSIATPWDIWTDAGDAYIEHANGCCRDILGELDDEDVNVLQKFRREVVRLNKSRPRSQYTERFHQILWRFRNRVATDPRDMVYGLLGVAGYQEIVPDYSLTKEQVFRQVTISSLEKDGNLNILMGQREQEPEIPSWIYDWSHPTDEFAWQDEHIRLIIEYYHASLDTVPRFRTEGERSLLIDGLYVDRIVSVGPTCDAAFDVDVQTKIIREWHDMCTKIYCPDRNTVKNYPNGSEYRNAFWRTLTGDITIRKQSQPFVNGRTLPDGDEIFKAWWKVICSKSRAQIYSIPKNLLFNMLVNTSVFGRRFFLTEKGYMGLGGNVREKDEVWVFFGGGTLL